MRQDAGVRSVVVVVMMEARVEMDEAELENAETVLLRVEPCASTVVWPQRKRESARWVLRAEMHTNSAFFVIAFPVRKRHA